MCYHNGDMRCFEHSTREALGSCVDCGKGVCLDCLNKAQGRIYCYACQPGSSLESSFKSSPSIQHLSQNMNQTIGKMSGELSNRFQSTQVSTTVVSDKNRLIAVLMAFLVGGFGVHKFYLGQNFWGVMYFLFSWTGIPFCAGLIEGVIYLTQSDDDFVRKYGKPVSLSHNSVYLNPTPVTPQEYERFLLQSAQRHGGRISMAHLLAESNVRPDKVEDALARLSAKGMVINEIDEMGHVHYYVQEFRRLE